MSKIENVVLNKFKDFMQDKEDNSIQLSVRDFISSQYFKDDEGHELLIVKYELWGSEIFKHYRSNREEIIYISFCGYNTPTTRQRIRIFESLFDFEINNIATGKYELKYCGNKFILQSDKSYEATYKLNLTNKTMSIL